MLKVVLSLAAPLLFLSQSAHALQMILSSREPQCINVAPKKVGVSVDISYTVSGVNESEVLFTVSRESVAAAAHSSLVESVDDPLPRVREWSRMSFHTLETSMVDDF